MPTKTEWTDETWNPIIGCSKISEGCKNCYAAVAANSGRLQQFEDYQKVKNWDGTIAFSAKKLRDILPYSKTHKKVFVCSMSDLFHYNATNEMRDKVFAALALSHNKTFQILTKRPERMLDYFNKNEKEIKHHWYKAATSDDLWYSPKVSDRFGGLVNLQTYFDSLTIPLENVWLGVSVENQKTADERIDILLSTPAKVKWLSVEPLLEEIDLRFTANYKADWIVVGGESGKNFRPMNINWMRSIVEQAKEFNIPVFVKQDSWHKSGQQGRIPFELWKYKDFPVV